jgi:hypothetical protein
LAVRRDRTVEDHVADKPGGDQRQHGRNGALASARLIASGIRSKKATAIIVPALKTEDQVQPIAQMQREQTAEQGHEERSEAQRNGHRRARCGREIKSSIRHPRLRGGDGLLSAEFDHGGWLARGRLPDAGEAVEQPGGDARADEMVDVAA